MKKLTLLFLLCLSTIINAHSSYNTNTFEDLGVTIETAIRRHCEGTTQGAKIKTNIKNTILPIGNIYRFDLGLGNGVKYYKVIHSSDSPSNGGINIDTTPNFGQPISDLCNSLSWKYHRPILIGNTELEAKNNFCSNTTVNNIREKVNLKIGKPLLEGEIYLMNFGLGNKYYKIIASDYAKGDSDYDLDTTSNNAVLSRVLFDNCPKVDIEATLVSVSSSSINHGENKTVSYKVKNIGNLTATSTRCEFYLASTTSSYMEFLKSKSIGNVNVNQTINGSTSVNIPLGTPTDTYNIFMRVSTNGDSNSSNNTAYSSSSFMVNGVQEYPDLLIDKSESTASVTGDKPFSSNSLHSIYQGESLTLKIVVKNDGKIKSGEMKVGIYITPFSNFDSANLEKELNFYFINPNDSRESSITLTKSQIDTYVASNGRGYIHVVVDNKNNVDEGSSGGEDNNRFSSIPVVSYNKSRSSKFSTNKTVTPLENSHKTYHVNVHDLTGLLIKSSKANSIEQENNIINSLPSGIYIIKTPSGTRKITK